MKLRELDSFENEMSEFLLVEVTSPLGGVIGGSDSISDHPTFIWLNSAPRLCWDVEDGESYRAR